MKIKLILLGLLFTMFAVAVPGLAAESDIESRLQAMEKTIKEQQRVIDELKALIKNAGAAGGANVAVTVKRPEQQKTIDSSQGFFSKQINEASKQEGQVSQQTNQELQQKVQELNERLIKWSKHRRRKFQASSTGHRARRGDNLRLSQQRVCGDRQQPAWRV